MKINNIDQYHQLALDAKEICARFGSEKIAQNISNNIVALIQELDIWLTNADARMSILESMLDKENIIFSNANPVSTDDFNNMITKIDEIDSGSWETEISGLIQSGYVIVEEIRTIFTKQPIQLHIAYKDNDENSGEQIISVIEVSPYEFFYGLDNLTKFTYNATKKKTSSLVSRISLRMQNLTKIREMFNNYERKQRIYYTRSNSIYKQMHDLYESLVEYDQMTANEGYFYEAYNYYKDTFNNKKDRLKKGEKIDINIATGILTESRIGAGLKLQKGGDWFDKQMKSFINNSPSITSFGNIYDLIKELKGYLVSLHNGEDIKEKLKQFFLTEPIEGSLEYKFRSKEQENLEKTLDKLLAAERKVEISANI